MSENKQQAQDEEKKKYIVLDIVFYGSSLNYDQGTGNYQELKKITKWDGKQYTLVSRYALRYSLLKTGEELGLWELAPGDKLERSGEGGKTVIQPSTNILLSGEILKYPDYDFFGYLITGTTPQNSREAPVKISHAVSLTPYNYDSHFAGNLDLARRMVEAGKAEKMDPNLFTVEEHQTYYVYTVVIDVERIGVNEVYLAEESAKVEWTENEKVIRINKEEYKEFDKDVEIEHSLLNNKIHRFIQRIRNLDKERKKRIKAIIKAILNLNRDIKGRKEFLHPKLLILGLYNGNYQTFKDRIRLSNAYEEKYEESVEKVGDNKVIVNRRVVKLRRPVIEIVGSIKDLRMWEKKENSENVDEEKIAIIDEEKIIGNEKSLIDKFLDGGEEGVWIYRAPEVEVKISER